MKLIIQRVTKGTVTIENNLAGSISNGYVVLIGIKVGDTTKEADKLTQKLLNLRIMSDENDHMNRSILDTNGELLIISQFTLYANVKGRRPGFQESMPPKEAESLFNYFIERVKESKLKVETGEFGAKMSVEIINDGPVTITLEEIAI